jgi:hypothetical protein
MSQREQVCARLDPEVLEIVERVAEVERRPVSQLIRNILSDWAQSTGVGRNEERAA